ncbi:hypothetical protein CP09DC78_0741 [Chlamydia psittaci 09DC78]|nr:hypothetical protein CP09DC77_0745 [Chlamydia psittaci 09DC77]EPJ26516.1 hypothetical protein CP09DC80_0747 [Chlamydia psittaci 09DC80]EPJ29889.1 hypothetical protein CP09DC78_0741 [Chlamydia psittaci 09DC78]EPL01274.1 hypothetical protein CP09DC79_0466 [Chlamydia psittaci 09DC79]
MSIEESKYRTLLLLSLLALGFIPLGAEQEVPTSLEQLENTSKELRTKEKHTPGSSVDSRSFGTEVKVNAGTLHPLPKYGQRVVLNGRLTEDAGTSCVDGPHLETQVVLSFGISQILNLKKLFSKRLKTSQL